MRPKVEEKIHEYVRLAQKIDTRVVTEDDLAPYPEPVKRYLRYAQILGKPRIRCAMVKQSGFMRTSPAQKWMPVEAVQYSTLAGPLSRSWYARIKLGPLTILNGFDRYDQGTGRMLMKLLSLFPVVDIQGPEIDLSALIIFINDMVMWPTAFLSDYIHWEDIDATSARARVDLHGKRFSVVMVFNDLGEMVNFITEDRYLMVGKGFEQAKWSTPLRAYREVNGLRIPTKGDAIWHLPEGEFRYILASIDQVVYDTFDFD